MWEGLKKRAARHADALKSETAAALKSKAAEISKAIGPQKAEPIKEPERPFGKEGGEDVRRVVWTGHKVKSPEGKIYYGAVGLTQGGYYRAAEVQAYGSDEQWRWQGKQYAVRDEAVKSAARITNERKGEKRMAQNKIPEAAKTKALEAAQAIKGDKQALPMKDIAANNAAKVPDWTDSKGMEAMREQKRLEAQQSKTPEPPKDKG